MTKRPKNNLPALATVASEVAHELTGCRCAEVSCAQCCEARVYLAGWARSLRPGRPTFDELAQWLGGPPSTWRARMSAFQGLDLEVQGARLGELDRAIARRARQ